MNIIDMIVEWYKLYETPAIFIGHKLTHLIVGGLLGATGTFIGFPVVSQIVVLAVGIGKEVSDHYSSYDEMSAKNGQDPYQYDAPMYAHVFDVIVTQIGGIIGLVIARVIM